MAYIAKARRGAYQIRLEERQEGVYVFVFLANSSQFPEQDYLQDDLKMAMEFAEEDYDIQRGDWEEVSNDHTLT